MNRTLLAFIIAPLIPTAALLHDAGPAIALVYSYVLTYLFGVPVYLTLKKKKKESHIRYLICGAVCAALIFVGMFFADGARDPKLLLVASMLAVVGGLEGLCFNVIRGDEKKTA